MVFSNKLVSLERGLKYKKLGNSAYRYLRYLMHQLNQLCKIFKKLSTSVGLRERYN